MGTAPRCIGLQGLKFKEAAMLYTGYGYGNMWIFTKDTMLSYIPTPPSSGMVSECFELSSAGRILSAYAKKDGYYAVYTLKETGEYILGKKIYHNAGEIVLSISHTNGYNQGACVAF